MKIDKDIIADYLQDCFEGDSEEFDEIEADCEFINGVETYRCEKVKTNGFLVLVKDYEVEIDEINNHISIMGDANASYLVTGYTSEGDLESWGYVENGHMDSESNFEFEIYLDNENYEMAEWFISI